MLVEGNKVKCFGEGQSGRLGHSSRNDIGDDFGETGDAIPFVDLGTDFEAAQVCAGGEFSCVLSTLGDIKCFGSGPVLGIDKSMTIGDFPGEMGDNLMKVKLNSPATFIDCGPDYACAILQGGRVKCWGENKKYSSSSETKLGVESSATSIGGQPGDMESLPDVKLGTGFSAKTLSCGLEHFCVAMTQGALKCYGNGDDGRRGSDDEFDVGGTVNSTGDHLAAVPFSRAVVKVSAGKDHTCVIFSGNHATCFGSNFNGQLGKLSISLKLKVLPADTGY